ncbi:MAG: ThiF family adenylyltransferase [Flavobacteriales bacterium]|nr:ThiF family adenylyltransferase [Flavobacteriales bacterium]
MSAEQPAFRIAVVGAGATGTALLPMLAVMPQVHITIVDGDTVDATNLGRQLLYTASDVGRMKVLVARDRLLERGALAKLEVEACFIDSGNASDLLHGMDLVCDCTDDLPARLLIDRTCGAHGIALVSGAVHGRQVQVATLHVAGHHPATGLREFFPGRTAEEQEGCLMQQVPAHVTTLAAAVMAEHINAIIQGDRSRAGVLELIDVGDGRWLRIRAPRPLQDDELIADSVSGTAKASRHDRG